MFALDELFGLPAHPLLVHIPVVLVPVTAAGAVWCAASSRWRARLGWIVVGLAAVCLVFIQLAMSSGDSLEERVDKDPLVEEHAEQADPLRLWEAGVLVLATGTMLVDRRSRQEGHDPRLRKAVVAAAVVTALVGVGSAVQVVQVGHSGAKAVWHDTPAERSGG